ncbi:hypothetical protein FALCPG4_009145 [Fusarium falciforme]
MTNHRSRRGCEECRRRRRKCDELKPTCGHCNAANRSCRYELRLVWSDRKIQHRGLRTTHRRLVQPPPLDSVGQSPAPIPDSLPNGVVLPRRYKKLLEYFSWGVLASLSSHPSIHQDLCRGLIPKMLYSPHLLSASLALSAAGLLSRGLSEVEGTSISYILEHLQSSGLSLLRKALTEQRKDEVMVATCLIWCLADVFAGIQGVPSWRIHLQGIKALLDGHQPDDQLGTGDTAMESAMRHLFLLYRSLQTLPYLQTIEPSGPSVDLGQTLFFDSSSGLTRSSKIDGFLGYSEELLDLLQHINSATRNNSGHQVSLNAEADLLLGKINGMISRDAKTPPEVSISSTLSPQYSRDFLLCHQIFQQATLIQLYRQLYMMPSASQPIQSAVQAINGMIQNMTQGQPCNTWVAMAMPLFTVGCEAFDDDQKDFILDKVQKLEVCIGSLHVHTIKRALKDVWKIRTDHQDFEGSICASQLLEKLQYNIILF